ncbi:MAG: manganese-dependent inorganic pyrophosphatase [Campylobacterales bacterium]|nr:manganese-dependent inorganic pyrophosphatase [Campylobacterales bacterium]
MAIYVYGHTNPDSDSIVGAISLAYLKNQLGEEAVATRQGKLNPESTWILEKFNIDVPDLMLEYAGKDVWLVDHSDLAQSPQDVKEANILGIVDHHKLGDITTPTPLECWIRPVGCSCTIVKEMFDFYKVDIPKDIAGAMLCAILSDTVIFKSPTCTKVDTKACRELVEIAGVDDVRGLGMEMFTVKSAVDGASPRELTTRDFKDFEMGGKKIGVGQLEVVDISILDKVKSDLFADINKLKEEGGRFAVLLLLTDIMKEGSQMLIVSDDDTLVEKAFGVKPEFNEVWLDKVMSRKKQIIPNLEKLLA